MNKNKTILKIVYLQLKASKIITMDERISINFIKERASSIEIIKTHTIFPILIAIYLIDSSEICIHGLKFRSTNIPTKTKNLSIEIEKILLKDFKEFFK